MSSMMKAYCKKRLSLLLFMLAAFLLYPLLHALYGESARPALYGDMILFCSLLVYVVFDYIAFRRRRKTLAALRKHLSETPGDYPRPADALEADYQTLVEALYRNWEDSRRALVSARKAQSAYFAMWVHQMKTPLAAIRLALQPDEDARAVIEQEVFSVERYADMALQFARLEVMQDDLLIHDIALAPVVRACVRKFAPFFIHKGLTVTIGDLPQSVPSDEKWLAFILEQALSNAVKYTDAGGVTILYEHGALVITDTGRGVPKEDLPRLFDRGFTGGAGRRDPRATGLGLQMARRVADGLGVSLSIESEWGKGTRFIARFPRKLED